MKIFRKAREMWSTKLRRDRLSGGFSSLKQILHLGPPEQQFGHAVASLKQLAEEIHIFKQTRKVAWQAKLDLWNVESKTVDDGASDQAVLRIEEDFVTADALKSMDYQWVAPCLANVMHDESVVDGVFEVRPREVQQSLDQIVARANSYVAMIDQVRKKGTHKWALLHRTGLLGKVCSLRQRIRKLKFNAVHKTA